MAHCDMVTYIKQSASSLSCTSEMVEMARKKNTAKNYISLNRENISFETT